MTAMTIIQAIKSLDIFFIGTTTIDLSENLMDLFSFTIDFPLPSAMQRSELIQNILKEWGLDLLPQDVHDLVDVIMIR
jgi:hypothetical protein